MIARRLSMQLEHANANIAGSISPPCFLNFPQAAQGKISGTLSMEDSAIPDCTPLLLNSAPAYSKVQFNPSRTSHG